ncbi:MAG: hypothetical protein PHR06_01815, partial [Candidatus Cloacimonetes bacterium]|nr:hypothetical protein [Candidatus Cloacimonadota bacterium]
DSYGYRAYDSFDTSYSLAPEYDWIEIDPAHGGQGTNTGLSDGGNNGDSVVNFSLPFNFVMYGVSYNNISVCSNGWAAFGITEQVNFRNLRLPGPDSPAAMLAPFWDDLVLTNGGAVFKYYDSANHRYVIQWSRVRNYSNTSYQETFQIVLFDQDYYNPGSDGDILYQYHTVNNIDSGDTNSHGEYATVGIKDHTHLVGLEYTYNNEYPISAYPLQNDMAILFSTRDPQVLMPPVISLSTTQIDLYTVNDESTTGNFTITNSGESDLVYTIAADYPDRDDSERASGGPDGFGYIWIDSDETNGPVYSWRDIVSNNTQLSFSHNDNSPGTIPLQFDFPFYGLNYSEFRVNPNGWIGFGDDYSAWTNTEIPSSSAPRPAIFTFWDDLHPLDNSGNGSGTVHYLSTPDSVVVWFNNVQHYGTATTGVYDFQTVFYPNGHILMQYRNMTGTLNSATIGTQNSNGNIGLQVNYNSNYVQNEFAVLLKPVNAWLSIDSVSGIIASNNSVQINLTALPDMEIGSYLSNLIINSNDVSTPIITLPVWLHIQSALPPAAIDNLQITLNQDIPVLNWNPVTIDIHGNPVIIAGYKIYRAEIGTAIQAEAEFYYATSSTNSFSDENASDGNYIYMVTAFTNE